jgi:glycosyltransferase involved in cell wall biosynthesis
VNIDCSVVIPTRDRRALLLRTVRSVLAQRAVAVEVVVVDDGSADGTSAALAALDDDRVRTIRHDESRGVSTARNRGAEAAAGDWVAFLDDDDLWSPEKLRRQLDAGGEATTGWALTGAVSVDASLRIVGGGRPEPGAVIARELPVRNMVPAGASSVVVRSDVLGATGGFDTNLRHMSDWDLWIRLAAIGPPAVVAAPLVAYLQHSGNASRDWDAIPRELDVLDARYRNRRGGRDVDRAYVYRWIAWNALRERDRRAALRWYGAAVRTGDLRSIGRAAVGLLRPSVSDGTLARHRPDRDWLAAAEAWLDQVAP